MGDKPITINISAKTIFMAFLVVAGSLLILRLSDIVVLVFFSLIFAAAIHPSVINLEKRLKLPKWAAIALIYLIVLIITALIIVSVVPAVTSQVNSLSHNLPSIRDSVSNTFNDNASVNSFIDSVFAKLSENSGQIATTLASATLGILVSLFGFITFLVMSAYFVSGGKPMVEQALAILPDKSWGKRLLSLTTRISQRLGYWLRGQLVVSGIMFVAIYIGLSLLGVQYALTLALLAGLLESIPTFGAIISTTLGVLMALTISPSKAIAVLVLYLLVNLIQGNIITPQIMKRVLGVPAVLIIISLLVFGKLLGLVGVLLAAPMAAVAVMLLEEFAPETKRLLERSRGHSKKEASEHHG